MMSFVARLRLGFRSDTGFSSWGVDAAFVVVATVTRLLRRRLGVLVVRTLHEPRFRSKRRFSPVPSLATLEVSSLELASKESSPSFGWTDTRALPLRPSLEWWISIVEDRCLTRGFRAGSHTRRYRRLELVWDERSRRQNR